MINSMLNSPPWPTLTGNIGSYYNPDQPPKPEKPILRDDIRGNPSIVQSTHMESMSGGRGDRLCLLDIQE